MKLLWTRELDAQNPWEPEFHGIFSYQESGISFYYKDEHLVRCVHGQMDEPEILFEGKQGVDLISQAGGEIVRIEGAHDFPNPHIFPHINYVVGKIRGSLRILALE